VLALLVAVVPAGIGKLQIKFYQGGKKEGFETFKAFFDLSNEKLCLIFSVKF
jgi:hypothetical protein